MALTRSDPISSITEIVIGRCIKIHTKIGPGCFERIYEELLYYELIKCGVRVKRDVFLPIEYEELYLKDAYQMDLLVENRLVPELKSLHLLQPVCFNQLHTYLALTNLKHGPLLNFKVPGMKEGIHRVFNNFGKEEL